MTINQQYKQTLDYLYKQLPMFQRVGPVAFKKDLTNILALAELLGQPQQQFPAIHIAGTNGKGSVAHMLSAILQAQGYKTGLYTSPHYHDFRERIKINGQLVEKAYIIDFVNQYKEAFSSLKPSYFEINVAMAFDYFAKQKVDIAVIETGLGGRLDSTNILQPLLSIITNISYDHTNFLGNTLAAIAGEKAGIIKNDIPVIIGETQQETQSVFIQKAAETGSTIYFADQHFSAKLLSNTLEHSYFDIIKDSRLKYAGLKANLMGNYQAKNLVTVLQSIDQLKALGLPIEEEALRNGLAELKKTANFIGRWQILGRKPLIIADSAHNEAGLQLVVNQLKELNFKHLHFVYGTVNDKDLSKVLPLLPSNATYYFAKANIPRGMDAKNLQKTAQSFGLKGRAYISVKNALQAAKKKAGPNDLLFIGGSIFVVGEIIKPNLPNGS